MVYWQKPLAYLINPKRKKMVNPTLPQRKDYISGKVTQDEYYRSLYRESHITITDKRIIDNAKKALTKGDVHLNRIPLRWWDAWAKGLMFYNGKTVAEAFHKQGDYPTLSGLVSMLKTAVLDAARGDLKRQ